jgi:hypothetical protein
MCCAGPMGGRFTSGKDMVTGSSSMRTRPAIPTNGGRMLIRLLWRLGQSVLYEIDYTTQDADRAFLRETELIVGFNRLHEGGPLTNLAAGGGSILSPAPESKEKHSATLVGIPDNNAERATLNRFFLGIAPVGSVPIKPASQFRPRPTQRYPQKSMAPTLCARLWHWSLLPRSTASIWTPSAAFRAE